MAEREQPEDNRPPSINEINRQLDAAEERNRPPSIDTINRQLDAAGYQPRAEQPGENEQAQEDTQPEARAEQPEDNRPPSINEINRQLDAAEERNRPPSIDTINRQLDAAGYQPRAEQPGENEQAQEDTQPEARAEQPEPGKSATVLEPGAELPTKSGEYLIPAQMRERAEPPGKSVTLLEPGAELPTKSGEYLIPAPTRERTDPSKELLSARAVDPLDDLSITARCDLDDLSLMARAAAPEEDQSMKDKTPIGPTLDLSHIIKETSDILKTYRNFLSDRKTKQAMAIYYLRKLSSTLEEYFNFQRRLDNFFCQHDILTAEMYCQYTTILPVYGDYKKIIKDTLTAILLPNISAATTEADVRQIVIDVTEVVFAGGNYTLTMNKICKNIYSSVVERRGIVQVVVDNFHFWFDLLEKEAANNEKQSENMFEILSYILFLNSGINEEPLCLKIPTCGEPSSSD